MYRVTGITGQVGGEVGNTLLAAGRRVRAVVRSEAEGAPWAAPRSVRPKACSYCCRRCSIRHRTLPESRANIEALFTALKAAAPGRIVVLSTIGAQAVEPNLLSQLGEMEAKLRTLPMPMPMPMLRPAWFIENAVWDIETARTADVIPSFLQPLDKPVRMEIVPRDRWYALFRAHGMRHPLPRMRMIDGFNEGWIEFERPSDTLKVDVTVEAALRALLSKA
jgi:uncharacterized protein YbjT (DUF2867 family)